MSAIPPHASGGFTIKWKSSTCTIVCCARLRFQEVALDGVARPSLAAVAGPDVDVAGPVEFDPARDETLEQRLVDVDRVGIDGILVAGVDLREGANLSETDEYDRNIGKTRVGC